MPQKTVTIGDTLRVRGDRGGNLEPPRVLPRHAHADIALQGNTRLSAHRAQITGIAPPHVALEIGLPHRAGAAESPPQQRACAPGEHVGAVERDGRLRHYGPDILGAPARLKRKRPDPPCWGRRAGGFVICTVCRDRARRNN